MDFLFHFLTMYVKLYVLSLFFVGVDFVNLFAAYIFICTVVSILLQVRV